jgi:hypothetical protein
VNRTPSPDWPQVFATWPKPGCRQPTDNGSMGPTGFVHAAVWRSAYPGSKNPYKVRKKRKRWVLCQSSLSNLLCGAALHPHHPRPAHRLASPRLASPSCPLVHGFRRRLPSLSQRSPPSHKFLWRTPAPAVLSAALPSLSSTARVCAN